MERQYTTCKKVQIISLAGYVIFMIALYCMIYAELSYTAITVIGVMGTVSLITTVASGIIRAVIGDKMGFRSTKKDWLLVCIALMLVIVYYAIKFS